MLLYLHYFYTFLHLSIIFINLFGWIHPKTRNIHLIIFSLTAFNWLVLGFFYGFGYCFLTDWHYQILYQLGYDDLPLSFITFFLEHYLSLPAIDEWVILLTGWIALGILFCTLYVNIFKGPKKN